MRVPEIEGKKIILRGLDKADLPAISSWMGDPHITIFLKDRRPLFDPRDRDAAWRWQSMVMIETVRELPEKFVFIIADKTQNNPIGLIQVSGIEWTHGACTTTTLLGDTKYHGKGYATDAKMAFLDYMFNELGFENVHSQIVAVNKASLKLNFRCGAEVYGKRPRNSIVEGRRYDDIQLTIRRVTWLAVNEEYQRSGGTLRDWMPPFTRWLALNDFLISQQASVS